MRADAQRQDLQQRCATRYFPPSVVVRYDTARVVLCCFGNPTQTLHLVIMHASLPTYACPSARTDWIAVGTGHEQRLLLHPRPPHCFLPTLSRTCNIVMERMLVGANATCHYMAESYILLLMAAMDVLNHGFCFSGSQESLLGLD